MSRYVPKHLGADPEAKSKSAAKAGIAAKALSRAFEANKTEFAEFTEFSDFEEDNPELHDIDDSIYEGIDGNAFDLDDIEEISGFTASVYAGASDGEIPENAQERSYSRADEIYMYFQTVLESIVAAFLILTFVLSVSMVIGSSMEPTLWENDRVVIMRLFYKPDYGDIIAVWAEGLPNRETGGMGEMIVKRVIGLEGDVIDIDKETGTVYRNGVPLEEDYIKESINKDHLGNAVYPVTVEENTVFVLGDNRNHSTDSRYVDNGDEDYYVGCIDLRYIMGKAVFRIYPFERAGILE